MRSWVAVVFLFASLVSEASEAELREEVAELKKEVSELKREMRGLVRLVKDANKAQAKFVRKDQLEEAIEKALLEFARRKGQPQKAGQSEKARRPSKPGQPSIVKDVAGVWRDTDGNTWEINLEEEYIEFKLYGRFDETRLTVKSIEVSQDGDAINVGLTTGKSLILGRRWITKSSFDLSLSTESVKNLHLSYAGGIHKFETGR